MLTLFEKVNKLWFTDNLQKRKIHIYEWYHIRNFMRKWMRGDKESRV